MMKRTFLGKGISHASSLSLQNISDLEKVIDWNTAQGIRLYRMSSEMFPWMSEYELGDLPDASEIKTILNRIGNKAKTSDQRLTFHPGPFNVLASANENVVLKTIKELRQHGEIMDMLNLPSTPFAKINIHVGGAYGNKLLAMERFAENFERLPEATKKRITVENDDKPNMFSVNDLLWVHDKTSAPIVFDYLHHQFCPGMLNEEEALDIACSTWPKNITPIVHYSSAKKKYEDQLAVEAAHADYIYDRVNTYGHPVDIMLEAKAKEDAVKRYQENFPEQPVPA